MSVPSVSAACHFGVGNGKVRADDVGSVKTCDEGCLFLGDRISVPAHVSFAKKKAQPEELEETLRAGGSVLW